MYFKSLVIAIYQRIACERRIVKAAARMVEAPILLDAIPRIPFALDGIIPPAGAAGCDFEHEVRRLAHFAYHIAVPGNYAFGIDTERHHAVRRKTLRIVGRLVPQVAFARDQYIIPVGEIRFEDEVEGDYTF